MINWKVRFKNKAWLLTMAVTVIAFVYQVLGLLGFVPAISQDQVTQLVTLVVNMLACLGIIVDPTTAGVRDSRQALRYKEPYKETWGKME